MYQKILIANDGSKGAAKALAVAIGLARQFDAALHMVSVEELPSFPATIDEVRSEKRTETKRFNQVIAHAKAEAKKAKVKLETHVLMDHVVPSIVELIKKERFDLLVVGYMGHSAIYSRLIGSKTDRLVDIAPCHVLVVK